MNNNKESSQHQRFEETPTDDCKIVTFFTDWKQYYFRWILFGFLANSLFLPVVTDVSPYWTIKLWQCLFGIFYGFLCGVVFSFIQNTFNKQRIKNRTSLFLVFIFLVWLFSTRHDISVARTFGQGILPFVLFYWLLSPLISKKK